MFVILLFGFFLLPVFCTAQLPGSNPAGIIYNTTDAVPQGSASLAFVFDITGSMYDDLVQVIEGAAKILQATLSRRDKPLYNYVLVPFHDPEVGPVTVTTEPGRFVNELRDLYVLGGGDCPEMSIGAIRKALEVSLPNSFIYVFTDARAKDYNLTEEVLGLIQEKQSQVVFVMTGDCGNTSHEGFKAYETIAATSSGQVFLLKKSQVNEVLRFVSEAVQSRKVNLMSTDHALGGKTILELPIDANLQEITISVSGENPSIAIYGPGGEQIDASHGLSTLLAIKRALILNFKEPRPGTYKLVVESTSDHTIRITGLSNMDFIHGFSRHPTDDLSETILRPVKNLTTYAVVNTTGLLVPGAVESFKLVDLQGKVLVDLPTQSDPKRDGLYSVSSFLPPDDYFYIKIQGIDQDGNQFLRMSPTAITPVLPKPPTVTVPEITRGHYDRDLNVTCSVHSLVPYYVQWYKDGIKEGPEKFYTRSGDVNFLVEKASIFSEGVFTCNITNTAGSSLAETLLDVRDPPPTIVVPTNITVTPGDAGIMTCIVYSSGEVNLTWYRQINQLNIPLQNSRHVEIFNNGSIVIGTVGDKDQGKYICEATNEGGRSREEVFLFVHKPPKVEVIPRRRSFIVGESVNFTCSSTGYPKPVLSWYRLGRRLLRSERVQFPKDGMLQLKDLELEDLGEYECRGRNPAGEEGLRVFLDYIEPPTVKAESSLVTVALGDSRAIRCEVTGVPDPHISWYKGEDPIAVGDQGVARIFGRELFLISVQEHDAGQYTCVAENEAGKASAAIMVATGSIPSGNVPFYGVAIDIGKSGTLKCEVNADPPPRFYWSRKSGRSDLDDRFKINDDGSLSVTNVKRSDEGLYVCRAVNELGTKDVTVQLAVTGIILPKISSHESNVDIPLTHAVNLTCTVVEGFPTPTLVWIKDETIVKPSNRLSFNEFGTLRINSVEKNDAGDYTCLASNEGGNSSHSIRLNVQVSPVIKENSVIEKLYVVQGEPVTMKCISAGDPRPILRWSKGHEPVSVTDPHYIISEDGGLSIFNVDPQDSDLYTCTASNIAGYDTKQVELLVYVRPTIAADNEEYQVINDTVLTLPCAASGMPEPTVEWYKDGKQLSRTDSKYNFWMKGSLEIRRTMPRDIGLYECRASNVIGNASRFISVDVQSPPVISEKETDQRSVEAGQSVVLECLVKGFPPPRIRWQRNRIDIDPYDPANVNFVPQDNGALYIHRATPDASSVFTCIAENPAGISTKDINVVIYEKPTFPGGKRPGNASVIENKPARIPCPAIGTPTPTKTWYKNGERLVTTTNVRVLEDGTLEFDAAKAQDTGTYTCLAKNTAGETKNVVEFKVYVPPNIGDENGSNNNVPELNSSMLNKSVVLECKVDAVPPPSISWYQHGRLISNSTERLIIRDSKNGSSLTIKKVTLSDIGRYTCIARNIAGESEKNFDLDVQVPPMMTNGDNSNNSYTVEFINRRTAALKCEVSGRPAPNVTWVKDGIVINKTNSLYRLTDQNRRLGIVQVSHDNSGLYVCHAESIAGSLTVNFTATVLDPPYIHGSDIISRPTAVKGDNITLACKVTGKPEPQVTWFRGNDEIKSDRIDYYMERNNTELTLIGVDMDDAGRYSCRAENSAGATEKFMDLSIMVPPTIDVGPDDLEIQLLRGRNAIIRCTATGIPTPEVLWFRNRRLLNTRMYSNVEILAGGSRLRISGANVEDAGIYTCKAVNKAGEYEVDFELQILVPPNMDTSRIMNTNREVVVRGMETLICPATGVPLPKVSWYKDGKIITNSTRTLISPDTTVMKLSDAKLSDRGSYICRAVNKAGTTELLFEVTVLAPPRINTTNSDLSPRVIKKQSIFLNCVVHGLPTPTVFWLKNGAPFDTLHVPRISLRMNGRQLFIQDADITDIARYTCVARNKVGRDHADFDLEVSVAPTILLTDADSNINATKGSNVRLNCPAMGRSLPKISWWKGDVRLVNSSRISIPKSGHRLTLNNVDTSDTGVFRCKAVNEAGEASATMRLFVIVPPTIDDSNLVDTPTVLYGRTAVLECPVSGTPAPKITWLKDGFALDPSDSHVKVYLNGKRVRISNATAYDTARYTCIASNGGGELRRTFSLAVRVPPSFVDKDYEHFVSIPENRSIYFGCSASATPEPTYFWYKDDVSIEELQSSRIYTLSGGRQLHIPKSQTKDSGIYRCKVSNLAGNIQRTFNLSVAVPPQFQPDLSSKTNMQVTVGTALSIKCAMSGNPRPAILWYRNGILLGKFSEKHMLVSEDGATLLIADISKDDNGVYTCQGSNIAGKLEQDFNVKIIAAPRIGGGGEDEVLETNVVKGESVVFKCPVSASPMPTIVWEHDDRRISANDENVRFINNGHQLQLLKPDGFDAGRYTCIATNAAGTAKKEFLLSVNIKPTITAGPKSIAATNGTKTDLSCGAFGQPPPNIGWLKDGVNIIMINQDERFRVLTGGSLRISPVTLQDGGVYRCWANNTAGSTFRDITVTVRVPPKILTESIKDVSVIENEPASLSCPTIGRPKPNIQWQKGINRLTTSKGYVILDSGELLIQRTGLHDAGKYVCIAKNDAGSAFGEITLTVLVRPTVVVPKDRYITYGGQTLRVPCRARGVPKPKIEWFKDGTRIDPSTYRYSVSGVGTLTIPLVTINDAGVLTCVAKNTAGTVSEKIQLIVQVPPRILHGKRIYLTTVNEAVMIPCQANGIPSPDITWWRRGVQIPPTDSKYFVSNGTLVISDVQEVDHGSWVCSADSKSGHDSEQFTLRVQVPPSFVVIPKDQEVNLKGRLELVCHAEGIPTPTIEWTMNGSAIAATQNINGRSRIIINNMRKEDGGTYVCNAKNPAGSRKVVSAVFVRAHARDRTLDRSLRAQTDSVVLNCPSFVRKGYRIQWSYNGRPVQFGPFVQLLRNQSLMIHGTDQQDLDLYQCSTVKKITNTGNTGAVGGGRHGDNACTKQLHNCNQPSQECVPTDAGGYFCRCRKGYIGDGKTCTDYDECAGVGSPCQHACKNTAGSYVCSCPSGYRLADDGRHCVDIDECKQLNIECGPDEFCFNQGGSFECIDISCPANYTKNRETGYCVANGCTKTDGSCPRFISADTVQYRFLNVRNGVPANYDLVRLLAYNQYGVHLPQTTFSIVRNSERIPFDIRIEHGKGVVYTLRELSTKQTYRITVRAETYKRNVLKYKTTFILLISVSAFPY